MTKVKNEVFEAMISTPAMRSAFDMIKRDRNLPIKKRYWIIKYFDSLDTSFNTYSRLRQTILEEHADKDDKGELKQSGEMILVTDSEGRKHVVEKMLELTSIEIEIDKFEIELELLDLIKDDENKGLSGMQIKLLEGVFKYMNTE